MKNAPVKLPLIKMMSPSAMGDGTGMYWCDDNTVNVKGIYLNAKYHSDLKVFQVLIDEQVKSKWWVSNATACKSFVHEFGHHISNSLRWSNQKQEWEKEFINECVNELKNAEPNYKYDIYKNLKNYLSEYGEISEYECFAEAFAEYFGGKNPRLFAKIFGEKLDKIMKGAGK